jgi:cation transport regulator ChaB
MATNPPVPPKTAADLPAFKQGKLNTVERGLVKNAVEGAQKWMKDNEVASSSISTVPSDWSPQ